MKCKCGMEMIFEIHNNYVRYFCKSPSCGTVKQINLLTPAMIKAVKELKRVAEIVNRCEIYARDEHLMLDIRDTLNDVVDEFAPILKGIK
ncbi:MAG: hypothetical protein GY841_04280 [FCB group bacterium]|nr:hypothetical protein [FCB group bacterium]